MSSGRRGVRVDTQRSGIEALACCCSTGKRAVHCACLRQRRHVPSCRMEECTCPRLMLFLRAVCVCTMRALRVRWPTVRCARAFHRCNTSRLLNDCLCWDELMGNAQCDRNVGGRLSVDCARDVLITASLCSQEEQPWAAARTAGQCSFSTRLETRLETRTTAERRAGRGCPFCCRRGREGRGWGGGRQAVRQGGTRAWGEETTDASLYLTSCCPDGCGGCRRCGPCTSCLLQSSRPLKDQRGQEAGCTLVRDNRRCKVRVVECITHKAPTLR